MGLSLTPNTAGVVAQYSRQFGLIIADNFKNLYLLIYEGYRKTEHTPMKRKYRGTCWRCKHANFFFWGPKVEVKVEVAEKWATTKRGLQTLVACQTYYMMSKLDKILTICTLDGVLLGCVCVFLNFLPVWTQ